MTYDNLLKNYIDKSVSNITFQMILAKEITVARERMIRAISSVAPAHKENILEAERMIIQDEIK